MRQGTPLFLYFESPQCFAPHSTLGPVVLEPHWPLAAAIVLSTVMNAVLSSAVKYIGTLRLSSSQMFQVQMIEAMRGSAQPYTGGLRSNGARANKEYTVTSSWMNTPGRRQQQERKVHRRMADRRVQGLSHTYELQPITGIGKHH